MPQLASPVQWRSLLSGVDKVVHAAAIAHTSGIDEALYYQVNYRAVVELANAARGMIERLVFLSSVRAQCGSSAPRPLLETDSPLPDEAYGRSKLLAEQALAKMRVPAVLLRPTLIVGPRPAGNLKTLIRLAKTPLPLPLAVADARRSVLARSDLCAAIEHVLSSPAHIGETYLVAHPNPISIADMITALRQGLGRSPGLFACPIPLLRLALTVAAHGRDTAPKLFDSLVVSPTKLIKTGWLPSVTPQAALAEAAAGASITPS
jgi:UDP-glucose 4-epimerase